MKKPTLHLVGRQATPESSEEGRDSDASHSVTRAVLLGPVGMAFLVLLAGLAVVIIAWGTQ